MAKITLDDVVGGFNLEKINSNFQKVEDALNNEVLYRDNPSGEPNQMQNVLDMNGRAIINSPSIGGDGGGGASDAQDVTFDPTATILSTNVQDAIEEVELHIPVPAINFPQPVGLIAQLGSSSRYAREDHVHVGDGGGGGGGSSLSNAQVYAYQRSISPPVLSPGAVVYDFATASITTPPVNVLANGWTKLVPAGTSPLYVTVASASSTTTGDTINANEWSSPVVLAENGTNGANGLNVATIYLYKRSFVNSAPALPNANVTWQFTPPVASGLTNGWTQTVPASSGEPYLFVTTATAVSNTTTDIISPSEWAAATLLAADGSNGNTGPAGANGTRGTVNIAQGGQTSWSDAVANAAIASAGYGSPINRDVVTLYGPGFSQTRFYDSGTWTVLTAYINGNLLVSGTVAASSIAADTLTGQFFRTGTSGTRIEINNSSNNKFIAYNSSSQPLAEIGGAISGAIGGRFYGYSSLAPTVYSTNSASGQAIVGDSSGGSGFLAYGVWGLTDSINGAGVRADNSTAGGTALSISGKISTAAKTGINGIAAMNSVVPLTDNTYTCGASGFSWAAIYSTTALNVTSDKRVKKDVQDSDLGLEFINSLRPVSYKLIVGEKKLVKEATKTQEAVYEEVQGQRTHYGLIAQEVKEALGEKDSAIWCLRDKDNNQSQQSLRYEELIAPLIKAVQELSAEVERLRGRV